LVPVTSMSMTSAMYASNVTLPRMTVISNLASVGKAMTFFVLSKVVLAVNCDSPLLNEVSMILSFVESLVDWYIILVLDLGVEAMATRLKFAMNLPLSSSSTYFIYKPNAPMYKPALM